MNKLTPILLFIVVAACNNAEQKSTNNIGQGSVTLSQPEVKPVAFNPAAEIEKLNNTLKQYESEPQTFTVSGSKKSEVKGKKGTLITVDPSLLETTDGKPLGKKIEVELKELTNAADMAYANAQTVSDGRLLVSGGSYYIKMTSDGNPLKIKTGKTLFVRFPKNTDKDMELFYGQRDSLGQMNWTEAGQKFVKKEIKTDKLDTMYNRLVVTTPTYRYTVVVKGDTLRNISNERLNELALQGLKSPGIVFLNRGQLIVGDTMNMTKEERKKYVETKTLYDKMYDELDVSSLGWINCDRFYRETPTNLIVQLSPTDSSQVARALLVFKDINSMMSAVCIKKGTFSGVPLGFKARLITYMVKDGQMYADASDVVIEKEKTITPSLKQIGEGEFKKLMNGS